MTAPRTADAAGSLGRMPYDVVAFSDDTFFEALASHYDERVAPHDERARHRYVTREQLEMHRQAHYIARYLHRINVRTMVVEREYTDPHFLDDVAAYYVRSHEDYPRRCIRLHFFASEFDAERFRKELLSPTTVVVDDTRSTSFLQAHYMGFVVVRPLPVAIIGRTVLATYPSKPGRVYPGVMRYTAHLFGTELMVESLAYQQQDTVLAACATVALWSSFQKASHLFGTAAPTPAEITNAANSAVFSTRSLPSRGLTLQQMSRAIAEFGLEPEVVECKPDTPIISLICAYLDLGLPVVVNVDIETYQPHAITVVGYSLADTPRREPEYEAPNLAFIPQSGRRVDQLYVHDDNSGPFTKLYIRPRFPAPPIASTSESAPKATEGLGATAPTARRTVPERVWRDRTADDGPGDQEGGEARLRDAIPVETAPTDARAGIPSAESALEEVPPAEEARPMETSLPVVAPLAARTASASDVSAELAASAAAEVVAPLIAPAVARRAEVDDTAQSLTLDDVKRMVRTAVSMGLERLVAPKPLVYFEAPKEWPRQDDPSIPARIEPRQIIIPVYHKIRLAFLDLQTWLMEMSVILPQAIEDYTERAEWRTSLTTLTTFKSQVRGGPLPDEERERILVGRLPRFVWRSTLYEANEPRMELVFDATGMKRSFPLLDVLYYDDVFRAEFRRWVRNEEVSGLLSRHLREFLQAKT